LKSEHETFLLRKHGEKETRKFGMDDVFQSNSRLKQTRENGKRKDKIRKEKKKQKKENAIRQSNDMKAMTLSGDANDGTGEAETT
jgi:hypothetical protein